VLGSKYAIGLLLVTSIVKSSHGQFTEIEQLSIEEIRAELNQYLDSEFDRATDSDRISAILVRIKNFYERRPEWVQAQMNLPLTEIDSIHQLVSNWLESPNRGGDDRIALMCSVWNNTSFAGADRIDAALLAYEREIDAGYADFRKSRVEELLSELESNLSADTWASLDSYIRSQLIDYSSKISHSFFTSVVRRSQGVDSMELHCGN